MNKSILVVLCALLLPAVSRAQDKPLLDEAADATCTAFLAPILGKKEIAQLTVHRSIESEVVCSCTKSRMRDDLRLSQMYSMDKTQIDDRLRNQQVFSYAVGRILQSVLVCFNSELDATLNASPATVKR